jgi:signal transduction histidine kinase/CheY-like chemotaxis protein
MTSIHDDGPGSRSDEVSWRFNRLHRGPDLAASRPEELEAVLAVSRTGYCRLDEAGSLLFASPQLKADFGCPPQAHVSWPGLLERLAAAGREHLQEAVRAAFAAGTDVDLAVQLQPGSGLAPLALRGGLSPLPANGTRELLLTSRVLGDAQAQQLAQERQRREAAEAESRAKDGLLSLISHELRTPLMAILGWNRILALKLRDDAEAGAIPRRIESSAKSQLRMVDEVLDLVRINAGRLRIEPRPMQLAKVARLALDAVAPTAAAKGIELTAQLEDNPGALRGDPERLQQVVSLLLSNALKYTPAQGRVTVCLRAAQEGFELTVQDTGQGIAPELLPHVFDCFRQAGAPGGGPRQGSGLGLGLTLVREIVALHGGTVSAHSDGPGTGATFTVRLPAARPAVSPTCGPEHEAELMAARRSQGLKGLSILVVDDDADARTVVSQTLALEGAQVTVSDGAQAAYEQLQAAHFDIMVTDIAMPGEDGYALVRKLRRLDRGSRTLAIAVTGHASRSDVAAAMSAGFDVHVPKPVDFDAFVPMVRRLVRP